MSMFPLLQVDYSLIDTSSIMAFSGADYANPTRFAAYRGKIWSHIEGMIKADKLKTVTQVWPELEFNDPTSCEKLKPIRSKFILPVDPDADSKVLQLIWRYPKLVDHECSSYTRPPADPYLIVYAQKYRIKIITDEKPLAQRIASRKTRKLKIPDVCNAEGINVQCVFLEDFLKTEGVIP